MQYSSRLSYNLHMGVSDYPLKLSTHTQFLFVKVNIPETSEGQLVNWLCMEIQYPSVCRFELSLNDYYIFHKNFKSVTFDS